ncbi:hypothetical protein [Terriglobus sp. ADX1]|uniref:hypothetical protein n=1 Tax=Terriglobus sp. ADX1 TaxID=2794063 RepID=UPI002FE61F3C
MTFLTWGLILAIGSIALSIILFRLTKRSFPDSTHAARRYRIFNAIAPFLALGWLVATFITHSYISNHIAHQSVGYSPDPYVTLPNGYVVGSLNTYSGYVHAPGVDTDIPWIGRGYVRGIIDLELRDGRFIGTYLDSKSQFQPQGTGHVRNFVLDTRDESIQTSDTNVAGDFISQQDTVHQDQHSYWNLYVQNRHRWPTVAFWLILLGGWGAIVTLVQQLKPAGSLSDQGSI